MTTNIIDEFVEYLSGRHFNAGNLLSKLSAAGRRSGEKTCETFGKSGDLSRTTLPPRSRRFTARAPPQLIAATPLTANFAPLPARDAGTPYQHADGSAAGGRDPNDVAAARRRDRPRFAGRIEIGSRGPRDRDRGGSARRRSLRADAERRAPPTTSIESLAISQRAPVVRRERSGRARDGTARNRHPHRAVPHRLVCAARRRLAARSADAAGVLPRH